MHPLKEPLDDLFHAYGRHLTDDWPYAEYDLTWRGGELRLDIQAPIEELTISGRAPTSDTRRIAGHLSAWKRLAGQYWAATRPARVFDVIHCHLPTVMERPGSGGAVWKTFSQLLEDPRVESAVRAFSAFCREAGDAKEARMCELSLASTSRNWRGGKASSTIRQTLETRGSLSTHGGVTCLAPLLEALDPEDRLGALVELLDVLLLSSPRNCLSVHKLLMKHVAPLFNDREPLVREHAIAVAERWVPTLLSRKAFEEAVPMLDALIAYGVGIPDNLRHRFLCHLVLGNDRAAEEDWRAASRVYDGTDTVHLIGFESGSFRDYRGFALTVAAESQLRFARGEDPCDERRITTKHRKTLREPPWYRARARALLDEALHIVSDSEASQGHVVGSGYRGCSYGVLAMLEEEEGDLRGALEHYRLANEIIVAGGISWHRDLYRTKAVELAKQLETNGTQAEVRPFPEEFDPDWLVEGPRPPDVVAAALDAWGRPWEVFPSSPHDADGTPLAALLIEQIGPNGLSWDVVKTMKLPEYGDYDAYTQTNARLHAKFRDVIDSSCTKRSHNAWSLVFGTKPLTQIFGWYWDGHGDRSHPGWKEDLKRWVRSILDAPRGDAEAVLREFPDHVFQRMAQWYCAAGVAVDFEHFLARTLWDATTDIETVVRVFQLYRPIFRPGWARTPVPSKDFLRVAEPLRGAGSESLSTALQQFTREVATNRPQETELLEEKWIWPWPFCWHSSMEVALIEALRGEWDHKKAGRSKRGRRLECFGWLVQQVEAPALHNAVASMQEKHDKRSRKKKAR